MGVIQDLHSRRIVGFDFNKFAAYFTIPSQTQTSCSLEDRALQRAAALQTFRATKDNIPQKSYGPFYIIPMKDGAHADNTSAAQRACNQGQRRREQQQIYEFSRKTSATPAREPSTGIG